MTAAPPALPPFGPLLLAFDLDGTLLADGGVHLPPDTAAALERLRALGVKLAIVTGRDTPPAPVRRAMRPDVVATSNGGRIEVNGALHREARFDEADLRGVLAHELQEARVSIFTPDGLFLALPPGEPPQPWMVSRGYRPASELPRGVAVTKIGFYHPDVAGHAERLRRSHPHLVLTGGQDPYPHFLTVTPSGAHKAAALTLAAQSLDIPLERTAAFGDSDNDEVMLEVAGFAVQVGTLPLLARHADAQVPSHLHLGSYLEALAGRLERQRDL